MTTRGTKLLFLFLAVILSGCQSIRERVGISDADEKTQTVLSELEEIVVRLDGADANMEDIAEARARISALAGTLPDSDGEAARAAWSGRLYLVEGKTSEARREYETSRRLSPENLPSRVLGFRLERDPFRLLPLIDSSLEREGPRGELLIERAKVLFAMSRFSESAAAFDAAFGALREKPYYEETYGVFRDKARELRELEQGQDSRQAETGPRANTTWKRLIEITRDETRLLRFITLDRQWPAESLFARLLERSFIPITQNTDLTEWPLEDPASSETVLRSGAAWFLWHLNAEYRGNRGLLTRYSSRYANTPLARSPMDDLDMFSPFFDSVLGCLESKVMFLPDGRNFFPREPVGEDEYRSMLAALEKTW